MDSKEIEINSWLDSPVDEFNKDPYYIENKEDNYSVCETLVDKIVRVIECDEKETITNKNQFRDDVIELIYKYSHERR